MIVKSFDISKKNIKNINFYLFYGENEGLKKELIKNNLEKNYSNNIYRYEEKEINDDKEKFFNNLNSQSFFEENKLIIISRTTDKIKDVIDEVFNKNYEDIKFVFIAGKLEKKSKLRNFFEKEKRTICIPCYIDSPQTIGKIASDFFKNNKIPISQESLNLLTERTRGDRENLKIELNKINLFIKNKKKINIEEILKLTNLAENYNESEIADNCLSKNSKKIATIFNENNISLDDCIGIIRMLLFKTKRLLKLKKETENYDIEIAISKFKPPIFWKDKDIVKKQIKSWSIKNIESLLIKINEVELLCKKNSESSVNILSDFIIYNSKTSSN
jgi:DNA polymerase-3 subunit delta